MRTEVGIVGAGPAGLVLARLLQLEGIESIVVEARSRDYVQERVRAGVLEQNSIELLESIGAAERLKQLALLHRGIELRFGGRSHRIDMYDLTGRCIAIYGQNEVMKDLIAQRESTGAPLLFEAPVSRIKNIENEAPAIHFFSNGEEQTVHCDFIAGCDGFHGISRNAIPAEIRTEYERVYPFAWLGILANVAPPSDELIYTNHERGFALISMRSPTVSRLYLQCDPNDDIANWPDERAWEELASRLRTNDGRFELKVGPVSSKSITGMRSFVVEPMQYHNLFLAGDAAHIVPPTGAKGLNLALADTVVLSRALTQYYRTGKRDWLDTYSEKCLRRIWMVQRFSWWMTSLLHCFPDANAFDRRRQLAELDYVCSSRTAAMGLAENYTGLPLEAG
jgi:p-hydroxybenzoate 3-monooxygenase